MKTFNQKLATAQAVVATILALVFIMFMMLSFSDLTKGIAPLTSTVGVIVYALMAILFGHTASVGYEDAVRTVRY